MAPGASAPPAARASIYGVYRIVDLAPASGLSTHLAAAVNDAGVVAGDATAAASADPRAFRYALGSGTLLPGANASPAAINSAAVVVGATGTPRRATKWTASGVETPLGTLGGQSSLAFDVNDAGTIVGYSQTATSGTAFVQTAGGTMRDLNALVTAKPAGMTLLRGNAINNAGAIAGDAVTANGPRAFVYSPDGSVKDLGAPAGGISHAADINDIGHVVGTTDPSSGPPASLGFLYDGTTRRDIGAFDAVTGTASVSPLAVNDGDVVVGVVTVPGQTPATRAFVWREGHTYDLNDFLPANSGWTLLGAGDINAAGTIVGTGIHNGSTRAFMMVPSYAGASYHPIETTRFLDTRSGVGLAGKFKGGVVRHLIVSRPGSAASPEAIAITGNLCEVNATAPGFLSAAPLAGGALSAVNFPKGDIRCAGIATQLAPDGGLDLYYGPAGTATTDVILDVTGYYTAGASPTYPRFTSIASTRVVDTRRGYGGRLAANTTRAFTIGAAGTAVPVTAQAVFVNLTAVNPEASGWVELSTVPLGMGLGTIVFPLHDIRANGVTVKLAPGARLYATFRAAYGATDLVLDVTGYYAAGSGALFYPYPAGRILDSRINQGLAGPIGSRSVKTLAVASTNGGSPPVGATAVAGTLTAIRPTAGGYVSAARVLAWPPATSTVNLPAGDIRANGVLVGLDAAGRMQLVYAAPAGQRIDLVVDVSGYFR